MKTEEQKNVRAGVICTAILAVLAVLLVFSARACSSPPVDYEKKGDLPGAWAMAKRAVEKNLLSPSSAHFPFVSSSDVVTYLGGGRYVVQSYVDAQNSYGAKIRRIWSLELERKKDGKWIVGDVKWK